ncbi:MAG: radical SAM protein [bacterium]
MGEPAARIFAAAVIGGMATETGGERQGSAQGKEEVSEADILLVESEEELRRVRAATDLKFLDSALDRNILFAPELFLGFLINDAGKRILRDILAGKPPVFEPRTVALVNYLILHDILTAEESSDASAASSDATPPAEEAMPFAPMSVTLCPTTECNLRCIYCYASAGEHVKYMSPALAHRAVDYALGNAVAGGKKSFRVGFHGGGEPMMAFDLVSDAVSYARERTKSHGLEPNFMIGTNLCYDRARIDFLIRNMDSACVSLDGSREIQDRQRPQADGSGSFDTIARNLHILDEHDFLYSIRGTVTRLNFHELPEIVDYLTDTFKARSFHFEPITLASRAVTNDMHGVTYEEYSEAYFKAWEIARAKGKEFSISGTDIFSGRAYFCGASSGNFWVTPEGNVTTCAEVLSARDPLARTFVIGRYDPVADRFDIDEEKVRLLRKRRSCELPGCSSCLARYLCRSGCPVRVLRCGGDYLEAAGIPEGRCKFVLEVVRRKLEVLLTHEGSRLEEEDYLALAEPGSLQEEELQVVDFDTGRF